MEAQRARLARIWNQGETRRNQAETRRAELADVRRLLELQRSGWLALKNQLPAPVPVAKPEAGPASPQTDYYWDSLSWRALRLFRSVVNRVMSLPPEKRPSVESADEAWRVARQMQESLSWNIAAPLRWVESLIGSVRWVHHAKSGDSSDETGPSGS